MKFDVRKMLDSVRARLQSAWRWVVDKLRAVPAQLARLRAVPAQLAKLRAVPAQLARLRHAPAAVYGAIKRGAQTLAHPTERAWTVIAALAAIPIGAFLLIAPLRELATGRTFGLQGLLTVCWLITAAGTLSAGVGILCRSEAFRRHLVVALVCSAPLPLAFGYRTWQLAVKMRTDDVALKAELQPWVSGGLQITGIFLALSAFLFFLLRFKPLRTMTCNGSILHSRIGPVVGPLVGAVLGTATAYLVWLLCRFLAYRPGIDLFRDIVSVLPVDWFAIGGAVVGASAWVARGRRGRRPKPPKVKKGATPAPAP